MSLAEIQLSDGARWILGGGGTIIVTSVAAIYIIMNNQTQHWKERYSTVAAEIAAKINEIAQKNNEISVKSKELQELRVDPLSPARQITEQLSEFWSAELKKLRDSVQKLEVEIEAKNSRIKELLDEKIIDQAKIDFYKESIETLEKKVAVIREAAEEASSRKVAAKNALNSLQRVLNEDKSAPFEALNSKIRDIDASSAPNFNRRMKEKVKMTQASEGRREKAQQDAHVYQKDTSKALMAMKANLPKG